jgi:hypothetical protein
VEIFERFNQEMSETLAAIKARPITAERCGLRNLSAAWQELRLHSSASVDNPASRCDQERRRSQRRLTNGNSR